MQERDQRERRERLLNAAVVALATGTGALAGAQFGPVGAGLSAGYLVSHGSP